jgi:hypothetical protein
MYDPARGRIDLNRDRRHAVYGAIPGLPEITVLCRADGLARPLHAISARDPFLHATPLLYVEHGQRPIRLSDAAPLATRDPRVAHCLPGGFR